MWFLHLHADTIRDLSAAGCGAVFFTDSRLAAACAAVVIVYFAKMKSVINQGLSSKRCLRFRVPAPPYVDYSLENFDLVPRRL